MWSKKALKFLDKHYPPCGPCLLCGFKDKRHRVWDAIIGQLECEDDFSSTEEEIAKDFSVTIEHVKAVKKIRPYRRGGKIDT